MKFSGKDRNAVHMLSLSGNLLGEQENLPVLDHISNQIAGGRAKFVIDLSGIKLINSSGLGLLIRILTKARTAGGDAVLLNIPAPLNRILLATKLHTVFKSFEDAGQAANSLE